MSYLSDHPTNFVWQDQVRRRVHVLQARFPWRLFVNTYWDHPPDLTHTPRRWPPGYYDKKSFDVWGGGGDSEENYSGYRGKRLPKELGHRVHRELFHATEGPAIDWIIWNGRMWWSPATGGPGWTDAPPGPPDSDPEHLKHLHITYIV